MQINELTGKQHEVAETIRQIIKTLGCELVLLNDGQTYKVEQNGKPCYLYLEFKGENTRAFPPNSILASAKQFEDLEDTRYRVGNRVYGPSFDVVARPASLEETALLLEFIRRAIWCYKKERDA